MRPPIDGSVTLVTGASSGIGGELARLFAARARKLWLVARRRERLDALAGELRDEHEGLEVAVEACDLGDRAALAALCDRLVAAGGVDILVNNAGVGDIGMFDLSAWDKNEQMLELNVRALTYLTHRLVPGMVHKRKGGVLNVSSGFGLTFMPGFGVYIGTKHFVTGFSESLRLDLAPMGVVVTQVCPGPVATEFEENAGNFTGLSAGTAEISAERCARAAFAGFERGRAMVIPGTLIRVMMWLAALTPRFLHRLLYRPGSSWMRQKQVAAKKT